MKKLILLTAWFITGSLWAQKQVTGTVTDENGEPLAGVNIIEKGTNNGTTSDFSGTYQISVDENAILLFSYIGFTSAEERVAGKDIIDIRLKEGIELAEIQLVGSRSFKRTAVDTSVPVDVIDIQEIATQGGRIEINELLQYAAPSFNANKQSGSDGADHIDPATLRGLGPDQTLVLINGKRRHQSSLINVFGTRGRGNTGTDLNAIPAAAIKRIEILRDGAAAQYGSDAIAGVINIVLKDATDELSGSISYGFFNTNAKGDFGTDPYGLWNTDGYRLDTEKDGNQVGDDKSFDGGSVKIAANYGMKLGDKGGYANFTTEYISKNKILRPAFEFRKGFGEAAIDGFNFFGNLSFPITDKTELYAFGGRNYRDTDAFAFTRNDTVPRNVLKIYPDGFTPRITSNIIDNSIAAGIRTETSSGWKIDVSNAYGKNNFHYFIKGTLNASLEDASPTDFDAGGHSLSQNTLNIDFSKYFENALNGMNLAFGAEYRTENFIIFAGEKGSYTLYDIYGNSVNNETDYRNFVYFQPNGEYVVQNQYNEYIDIFTDAEDFAINENGDYINITDDGEIVVVDEVDAVRIDQIAIKRPGGSQGFPGYSPDNEVNRSRSNFSLYADGEFEFSDMFLLNAAARFENYSDFGSTLNGKLAARIKASDNINIRGSISTGFRAPSLAQIYYNLRFTDFQGGVPIDVLLSANNSTVTRSFGIGQLKEETSFNGALGFTATVGNFTATIDGYYIGVKDRIVLTGKFDTMGIPGVNQAQFFANGADTQTTGLDAVFTWKKRFDADLSFAASLVGNINNMKIKKVNNGDLDEEIFFGERDKSFLLASAPDSKFGLNLNFTKNWFDAALAFTRYSKIELLDFQMYEDVAGYGSFAAQIAAATDTYDPKVVTDLALGFKLSDNLKLNIGSNNLFNVYPNQQDDWSESGGYWDAVQMGFSGAYYYTRLNFNF